MKPLIVYSEEDAAGKNTAARLVSGFGFGKLRDGVWEKDGILLARLGGLHIYSEMRLPLDYDYIIVASRHRSESGSPSLTAHIPGNWGSADFGGKPRTLNTAYASKLKVLLREMKRKADEVGLGWSVSLEVDHHGPTIGKPILYAEIGSSEKEWGNETAVEVLAHSIMKAAESSETFDAFFGVGGNHYAPAFTGIMLGSERRALGHMLPKYKIDEVGFDVFGQALAKNVEELQGVLLDWKGMSSPQREKIIGFCEGAGTKWEKI